MAPRNPRHDRESVTDIALALLDEVGLPDLSMRRLAAELDVQPSALYWHFENKQELLAAVADRIVARIPIHSSVAAALPARLLLTARGIRDALLSYRDGAEVVMSTSALGLGAARAQEAIVEALGVDVPDSARRDEAAAAILQFVLGHTTLLQQRMHAESHGADASEGRAHAAGPDLSDSVFDAGIALFAFGLERISGVLRSAPNPAGDRG